MNLKTYDYSDKWLDLLVYELYKFNLTSKMDFFSDVNLCKSIKDKTNSIKTDLTELINRCDYKYITIDEDLNKIYAFSCFLVENQKCYNKLIFKSTNYPMTKDMFRVNVDMFDKIKDLGFDKIYSIIDRFDENRYIKFLKRYYNVKINKKKGKKTELIFSLRKVCLNH